MWENVYQRAAHDSVGTERIKLSAGRLNALKMKMLWKAFNNDGIKMQLSKKNSKNSRKKVWIECVESEQTKTEWKAWKQQWIGLKHKSDTFCTFSSASSSPGRVLLVKKLLPLLSLEIFFILFVLPIPKPYVINFRSFSFIFCSPFVLCR